MRNTESVANAIRENSISSGSLSSVNTQLSGNLRENSAYIEKLSENFSDDIKKALVDVVKQIVNLDKTRLSGGDVKKKDIDNVLTKLEELKMQGAGNVVSSLGLEQSAKSTKTKLWKRGLGIDQDAGLLKGLFQTTIAGGFLGLRTPDKNKSPGTNAANNLFSSALLKDVKESIGVKSTGGQQSKIDPQDPKFTREQQSKIDPQDPTFIGGSSTDRESYAEQQTDLLKEIRNILEEIRDDNCCSTSSSLLRSILGAVGAGGAIAAALYGLRSLVTSPATQPIRNAVTSPISDIVPNFSPDKVTDPFAPGYRIPITEPIPSPITGQIPRPNEVPETIFIPGSNPGLRPVPIRTERELPDSPRPFVGPPLPEPLSGYDKRQLDIARNRERVSNARSTATVEKGDNLSFLEWLYGGKENFSKAAEAQVAASKGMLEYAKSDEAMLMAGVALFGATAVTGSIMAVPAIVEGAALLTTAGRVLLGVGASLSTFFATTQSASANDVVPSILPTGNAVENMNDYAKVGNNITPIINNVTNNNVSNSGSSGTPIITGSSMPRTDDAVIRRFQDRRISGDNY